MQTSRFSLFSRALLGRAHSKPSVSLGLQGGGAHGAFTWGVLDALLQDGRRSLAIVSGTSGSGIRHRTLEFAFNGTFLREIRLLAQWQQQAQTGWLRVGKLGRRLAEARFHLIEATARLTALGVESKLVATLPIFKHLMALGRAHAQAWLNANATSVGHRSTVDLASVFGAD